MPYVAVKMYPKDEETRKKLAEKLCETVMEVTGCPAEAVTVSLEEVAPEDWVATVKEPEIMAHMDKMMIVGGKKQY